MTQNPFLPADAPGLPARRRLLQGLMAGGLLAGLPGWARAADGHAHGQADPRGLPEARLGSAPVLTGPQIDLVIGATRVGFGGRPGVATTVNGSLPGPTLRLREGEEVTIRVTNRLAEPTSIHWHGIILPYQMDGVPGISFDGIAPGATFTYRFRLEQSGTFWYHSHSGHQEQVGLYGALVVEPRDGERLRVQRDHVVLLSDWTEADPGRVMALLKTQSDYYNLHQPTLGDFLADVSRAGLSAALAERRMWNEMRMSPTDLADVSAAGLTFLVNGMAPQDNWTGLFRPGEKVRLRFINGAGNTFYDVRIPGLKLSVVAADGQDVEPVTVDEFRFGPGETYDVVVSPTDDAYTIFAQSMDRSGYACATLAVREGLRAAVPALDRVEWLSMTDMMGAMDHAAHGGAGTDHAGMDHAVMGHAGMDHGAHGAAAAASPLARPSSRVRHARTEYGPSTDMRVDTPRTNLDDPGVGLRNNGRRVLTLADLATLGGPLDPRGPEREIELHLTGNMERYTWSFDGQPFADSRPVRMAYGERLRVILHNDTMMTHPMHMHGLWSELETPDGRFQVRRHTLPVQPAQRVSYLVTADALGRWVWHCHLMMHMHAGMFREVVIA